VTLAWVVGSGGMLGSHVASSLTRSERREDAPFTLSERSESKGLRLWQPTAGAVPWSDPAAAIARLDEMAAAFLAAVKAEPDAGWAVVWCAGAGVVGTSAAALELEVRTWDTFLEKLGARVDAMRDRSGFVFLASSAGGVHGGCTDRPITERSLAAPISPYGRAKLAQEERLAAWAAARDVSTLVAHISNLYGPGQKMDKPQGLISHMSRTLIHREAIHIYVSLDSIRDYLYVGDAGRWIVEWIERVLAERAASSGAVHIRKICAAEEETTIAALIGVFRRVAKRHLKVINGIHPVTGQQPRKLQFRSVIWTGEPAGSHRTGLLDGVARVYRHQLGLYEAGELPPPSRTRV
jgi:UDP-glucose 4-epimerase